MITRINKEVFGLQGTFWFHDAFYFVVCTITTIGYGDISPATAETRMITVVAITVTFVVLPMQFQKLLVTLDLQSAPYNRSFHPPSITRPRSVLSLIPVNNSLIQSLIH
jgi:hypothetical protein